MIGTSLFINGGPQIKTLLRLGFAYIILLKYSLSNLYFYNVGIPSILNPLDIFNISSKLGLDNSF